MLLMKRTTNLYNMMRWLTGCLIFLSASCGSKHAEVDVLVPTAQDSILKEQKADRAFEAIGAAKKNIRTGDLILRTGADFTSESLRSLCQRDQTYSHCGIASIEHDSVFVYHALGGEWNPDQKIRRDPIELFAEPYSNRGIGIYRFSLDKQAVDTLMQTVFQLYRAGVMFDMKFDLKTDDHMYCAEFVYKCYKMGTRDKLRFNKSHIGAFEFIGVDDLFLQGDCKKQYSVVYK